MRSSTSIFFILISLVFLSACSQPRVVHLSDPESIRRGQVAGLVSQLQHEGVQVAQIGETMRFVLPSDQLFNPRSANLNPQYMPALDTVAQLMIMLTAISAKVSGYTDCEANERINRALSTRQAQVVVDYLWKKGVDTRLLYAVGYGSAFPIVRGYPAAGNRRIEINFRYQPFTEGRI